MLFRSDIYYQDQDWEKAYTAYSALLDRMKPLEMNKQLDVAIRYGICALKTNRLPEAKKGFLLAETINPKNLEWKRLMDIVVGSVALLLLSPIMLLVAIIMKLSAPREAVFFRQTRLTRFNREFRIYKFRSQKSKYNGTTPEEAFTMMGRPELIKQYRDNGDQLDNDPRITRLGRFLRATSLDELPQLLNVVKGDISLVGPRALIPQEINQYKRKDTILAVKSGLTGLAQVSGRRDISFEERRQLDVYYVQNWSLWLDIRILVKTFGMVLFQRGAR